MMTTCPIRLDGCESKLVLADSLTAICNESNELFADDNMKLSKQVVRSRKASVITFVIGLGCGIVIGIK